MLKDKMALWVVSLLLVSCGGADPSGARYQCGQACLKAPPVLSVDKISSASGGVVEVGIVIDGELAGLSRVVVELSPVGGGLSAGQAVVFSPTLHDNTMTVTVAAGVSPGEYYPQLLFYYVEPANAGSQYYFDAGVSARNYAYYEWSGLQASAAMATPFPLATVRVE